MKTLLPSVLLFFPMGLLAAPSALTSRQIPSDNICGHDGHDPNAWGDSGAKYYLLDWFQRHNDDEHDWLTKMDQETTGNGNQPSGLDCKGLYAQNSCPIPTVQCNDFTPQHVWWVRQMAAQFNQYMSWMHETLQDYTIANSLAIDQIVNDMDVYDRFAEATADRILLSLLSFASLAGGVVAFSSTIGSLAIGAMGSAMVFTSANNTPNQPSTDDLARWLENWLEQYFWNVRDHLTKITNRMFGGDEVDSDTDILDGYISAMVGSEGLSPGGYKSKILQVFNSGAFLQSISQSNVQDAIDYGFQLMRKRLVATMLYLEDIVVETWRLDESHKDEYCNEYGYRYLYGWCFRLARLHPDKDRLVLMTKTDIYNKLEFTYGIDPADLYNNVNDCDNQITEESMTNPAIGEDSWGYPKCFFPLIIHKSWGKDCYYRNDNFPDWYKEKLSSNWAPYCYGEAVY
ncbi:hypothetical protein BJX70DRAFT_375550 [Aspergillus crustosus]